MAEKKNNLGDLYGSAMYMLSEGNGPFEYEHKGDNEHGFPIMESKDGSHSLQLIIFNFGKDEK